MVYPRACGGTRLRAIQVFVINGLSPRVRGNPITSDVRIRKRGSIPARAGEPPGCNGITLPSKVYPRACGGTKVHHGVEGVGQGLSPRVRGNQCGRLCPYYGAGSIPARAGEPISRIEGS